MEQTLQDLADLVLSALPTTLLVGLLVILLNSILFKPLAAIMAERDAATKGAVEQARRAIEQAEQQVAEYEKALRAARGEILRQQEGERLRLRQQQSQALAQARETNQALIDQAKRELAAELATARTSIQAEAAGLAGVMASAVVQGSRN